MVLGIKVVTEYSHQFLGGWGGGGSCMNLLKVIPQGRASDHMSDARMRLL